MRQASVSQFRLRVSNAVLVPNPFFRTRKEPVLSGPFDFGKPEDRAKLTDLIAPRWCMNTRVLAVIPASQWHMERAKAGLAILMPER
jgi:hypothetical protein